MQNKLKHRQASQDGEPNPEKQENLKNMSERMYAGL
jgi:hypothetical protein